MILPIVAYGDPVLKKRATEISNDYPNLKETIENMYESMYGAYGVGLAAPQVGLSVRIFLVDTAPFSDDETYSVQEQAELKAFKRTFINAKILEETGEEWGFNEGCLSIPKIREEVFRKENVRITYYNEKWELQEEVLKGYAARIVQHEYDHVEGVLFTDHLSTLKRKLLTKRLQNISKGAIKVDYKMKFPNVKKGR